jgi:benzoate-CoA ligase family protein
MAAYPAGASKQGLHNGDTLMTHPTTSLQPLPERFNYAQHLLACNAQRASKAAFIDDRGTLSYGQLDERVRRMAGALRSAGIKREERVLLLMHDCNDWPVSFLGAMYAGVVPVAVNTLLTADDYAYMLENSRAQAVLVSGALLPAVTAAMTRSEHEVQKVIVSNPVAPLRPAEVEFEAFLQSATPATSPASTGPDDPGLWVYSSGSTGRPKGAVHLQRDMVVTSELYGVRALGVREDDVSYSAGKLFFAYGLGNSMTFPLWTGSTAVLDDRRPTPDTTFETIETFKPTLYYGAPTLYAAQLAALEKKPRDFSSIRACVSAAEALPADILRRWKEKTGTVILDGIGSTECLHIFIGNRLDDYKPGTSGKPVPGYEVKIVDEHGKPVPRGEGGRLWIRSESAAKYYWNKPEKTAETMVDGWLNTGDTYRQDEDGYFIYDGRSDDMLKVGGIWCSPVEVESCLIAHPAVLEAAVVGHADENSLIKPKAFVVLKQAGGGGATLTDELMALCKTTLAPYKYPRWVEYVPELPKTATGKIQRYKLRG